MGTPHLSHSGWLLDFVSAHLGQKFSPPMGTKAPRGARHPAQAKHSAWKNLPPAVVAAPSMGLPHASHRFKPQEEHTLRPSWSLLKLPSRATPHLWQTKHSRWNASPSGLSRKSPASAVPHAAQVRTGLEAVPAAVPAAAPASARAVEQQRPQRRLLPCTKKLPGRGSAQPSHLTQSGWYAHPPSSAAVPSMGRSHAPQSLGGRHFLHVRTPPFTLKGPPSGSWQTPQTKHSGWNITPSARMHLPRTSLPHALHGGPRPVPTAISGPERRARARAWGRRPACA
mmetsp:Transcript_94646/g.264456  ORF Transcript_94646/g.264456 Transcript_94646/m.264456 type:complete len:283 (+) Transcript_94646:536-1384(+)